MHSRQVADERVLVEAGIHSRRRAADALGVEDPEGEFARWLEETAQVRTIQSAPLPAPNGAVSVGEQSPRRAPVVSPVSLPSAAGGLGDTW